MGCFAELGWAWNAKPTAAVVGARKASVPSAEFVESFVIFFYGSTNVFLEHLGGWGGAWSAQDFEHVSIAMMFFGGGLVGLTVDECMRPRLTGPVRYVSRIPKASKPATHDHPYGLRQLEDAPTLRIMGVPKDLPDLTESFPRARHLPSGCHDEFTSSGVHGVDHAAQAMGHHAGGVCSGTRCDLRAHLRFTANVPVAVAAAV